MGTARRCSQVSLAFVYWSAHAWRSAFPVAAAPAARPPKVQTVASAITLLNTQDGAAFAIERSLLNGKTPQV